MPVVVATQLRKIGDCGEGQPASTTVPACQGFFGTATRDRTTGLPFLAAIVKITGCVRYSRTTSSRTRAARAGNIEPGGRDARSRERLRLVPPGSIRSAVSSAMRGNAMNQLHLSSPLSPVYGSAISRPAPSRCRYKGRLVSFHDEPKARGLDLAAKPWANG